MFGRVSAEVLKERAGFYSDSDLQNKLSYFVKTQLQFIQRFLRKSMVKIIYTKVPADVCKHNRKFYQSHVRKAFIKWCAYQGYFDDVLTKQEVKQAKKGQLPKDLNIHHKIPLSGSNDLMVNDFCNLTVLHKKTHEQINRDIFSPQLKAIETAPFGTQIEIDVPAFGYVDEMGIRYERAKALFRNKKRER